MRHSDQMGECCSRALPILVGWVLCGPVSAEVFTHKENMGLQDGRHDRYPCASTPRITSWEDGPTFKINHEPYTNTKKVFLRKGELPPLTQISVADFLEGTYFEDHDHEDMFEMFYVLSGHGRFAITERNAGSGQWSRIEVPAEPGTLLHLPPGVQHAGLTDTGFRFLMLGTVTQDEACNKTSLITAGASHTCKATAEFKQLRTSEEAFDSQEGVTKRSSLLTSGELPSILDVSRFQLNSQQRLALNLPGSEAQAAQVFYVLHGSGEALGPTLKGPLQQDSFMLLPPGHATEVFAGSTGMELLRFAIEPTCELQARDEL